MWGNLFACVFFVLLGLGVWAEQQIMREFGEQLAAASRVGTQSAVLAQARPFHLVRSSGGQVVTEAQGDEGIVRVGGAMEIRGNVAFVSRLALPPVHLRSDLATGQLAPGTASGSLWGELQEVTLPGAVHATCGEDQVQLHRVAIDCQGGVLRSEDPFRLEGPHRRARGQGLTYVPSTGEFHIAGRAQAEFALPSRSARSAGKRP